MGKKRPKSPQSATESAKPLTPALIPQPNGKGALLSGGVPGNRGGGRTPDAIRRTLRDVLEDEGIPLIRRVMRGEEGKPCQECGQSVSVDQRLKAADMAAKYGLGETRQHTVSMADAEVRARLRWLVDELVQLGVPMDTIRQAYNTTLRPDSEIPAKYRLETA